MYGVLALVFIYAKPYLQDRDLFKGEFYALILFALLGMMLMISAGSLVTLVPRPRIAGAELLRPGGDGPRQRGRPRKRR